MFKLIQSLIALEEGVIDPNYKYFINNVAQLLEIDGAMYCEIPNSEITHQIIDMINNNSNIEGIFFKDLEGNKRVVKLSIKQL